MDWAANFDSLFTVASLISLLTLAILEVVLGIDNIIFISIIAGRLKDKSDQRKARRWGLMLALIMRVLLLFSITWIVGLTKPLFTAFDYDVTGRSLILFIGGAFLLVKTTQEIHHKIEGSDEEVGVNLKVVTLKNVILQIVLIDIVFSFDSILTAVGLVSNVLVMIGAVIISMLVMLAFAGKVADFINRHPTIKMLALSFLLMIAVMLILEAAIPKEEYDVHKLKPYLYFSMAFAFLVEMLNMRMRSKKQKSAAEKRKPQP